MKSASGGKRLRQGLGERRLDGRVAGEQAGQAEHDAGRSGWSRTARRRPGRWRAGHPAPARRCRGPATMAATRGRPRTRSTIAPGSIAPAGQSRTSSNRPGWTDLAGDPARAGDQRPDLAAPDVAPAAELDALEPTGRAPSRRSSTVVKWTLAAARMRLGLGQRDPVGGRRHRSVACWSVDDAAGVGRRRGRARARPRRPAAVASDDFVEPDGRLGVPTTCESEPSAVRVRLDEPAGCADRRSFFAQPEPLKWIAGAVERLAHRSAAAQRAGRGAVVVDAMDDLEPRGRRRRSRSRRWASDRSGWRQPRSRRMPHLGQ